IIYILFFQAEDGIRDFHVTGVQTCALPILIWESNEREDFDIIVWCTGFKYATKHLNELGITGVDGRVVTEGTRAKEVAGLWLVRSEERRVGKECRSG